MSSIRNQISRFTNVTDTAHVSAGTLNGLSRGVVDVTGDSAMVDDPSWLCCKISVASGAGMKIATALKKMNYQLGYKCRRWLIVTIIWGITSVTPQWSQMSPSLLITHPKWDTKGIALLFKIGCTCTRLYIIPYIYITFINHFSNVSVASNNIARKCVQTLCT